MPAPSERSSSCLRTAPQSLVCHTLLSVQTSTLGLCFARVHIGLHSCALRDGELGPLSYRGGEDPAKIAGQNVHGQFSVRFDVQVDRCWGMLP